MVTINTKWFGICDNPFCTVSVNKTTIYLKKGILMAKEDSVKFWDIIDYEVKQSLFDRLCNRGTIILHTKDLTNKIFILPNVGEYEKLRNFISKQVDKERELRRRRSSYLEYNHTPDTKLGHVPYDDDETIDIE